ncbi:MAG: DUF4255 domain-containing protein [Oscillatoriaceae cyanobacterium Prado104]|nr:DUF4255 domain-containing protein [Oscillatoriaceae cyanobacterium Prado104]
MPSPVSGKNTIRETQQPAILATGNTIVLEDLDSTLETFLRRELPPSLSSQVEISFAAPDSEFRNKVTLPAIGLFLYDIRENLDLRSSEWSLERTNDGRGIRKRPPARVDCSYLITAWPSAQSDPKTEPKTEHMLLGQVMKALIRYPKLPATVLEGSLKDQEPPIRSISLRPSLLNSLGEFWQAIGGKPKAALNYTLTIAVPVDETGEFVSLAIEKQIGN